MANQYDVKPGIFETVTSDVIGSFTLDVWEHFKLDGEFKFLVANPVIKQGVSVVPGSAYELKIDTAASSQETTAAQASRTLYGQMRITNVTYANVELNLSGDNYGTYASNESVREHTASSVDGKMAPDPADAFIDEGEPAVFTDSGGKLAKSDNSGQVAKWDSGTVYNAAGTLVRLEGITYTATGEALNQAKDPRDPNNVEFWYLPDDEDDLMRQALRGPVVSGDMHTINDRASGNYAQTIVVGKKAVNSVQYNYHMVHLDGTQVTGNATLEAIFDVGGGDQYAYLDKYAPDVVGTRTLKDMGGRTTRAQSVSGKADTTGEVQEDAMQRITGDTLQMWGGVTSSNGVFTLTAGTANRATAAGSPSTNIGFDSLNSVIPNTAKTDDDETRMANIVVGASFIIVMVPA